MEITNIQSFLQYYIKVKKRTRRLFSYIPAEQIEWTYREGKFTIGDLIRHIACIERYMFAENVQLKPSLYQGCGPEYAEGYHAVVNFYDQLQEESTAIFTQLTPEELQRKCTTPGGTPITTWKWLRLMLEHEIHHRAQIYTYLSILELPTPPLYGMTAEEVESRKGQ